MDQLDHIAREIRQRGVGVALTGAGISAESGILTYRDQGGLWDTYPKGASGGMLGVLAASLPGHAKKNGAFLVEVNPKKSALSDIMDVFVCGATGDVLPVLAEKLRATGLPKK